MRKNREREWRGRNEVEREVWKGPPWDIGRWLDWWGPKGCLTDKFCAVATHTQRNGGLSAPIGWTIRYSTRKGLLAQL